MITTPDEIAQARAALRARAVELLNSAPAPELYPRMKKGELGLDDSVTLLKKRGAWLRGFGELLGRCGPPSTDQNSRDIPLAPETPKLLEHYEMGFDAACMLDGSPATLTYLWLKSFMLRGQSAAALQQLEALYERWASQTKAQPVAPVKVGDPDDTLESAPDRLLVAWLKRWGFESCEFIVLDTLEQASPGSVVGDAAERLRELRRKLVNRVRMPKRDLPYLPVRIRITEDAEKYRREIEHEVESHLALPAYLLRRAGDNRNDEAFAMPDKVQHAELLVLLAENLRNSLRDTAQDVRILPVRTEAGTSMTPARDWLQVTPARALENGLPGAAVWIDIQLQQITRKEARWLIYGGVDPDGMLLDDFLKVAHSIKNQHDQALSSVERNIETIIGMALSELAKTVRRAASVGPAGVQGGKAV